MSLDDIRSVRLEKLQKLRDAGHDAYPAEVQRSHTLVELREQFKEDAEASVVGRVMATRGQGAIVFCDLFDGTGKFQVVVQQDVVGDESHALFLDTVDVGDFLEVNGTLFTTKRGEQSLKAQGWRMVSKSLRPLPEKWHGLKDTEERYRRRYLDTLMDEEVRERFVTRARVISTLRRVLDEHGYLEVETPVLQLHAGGATAKPFTTHYNALDREFQLRIAPELFLKELLIGGYPKVYEVARNFRNEGIDATHNPEFTMLEFYEAYTTKDDQMRFTEEMLREVVRTAYGTLSLTYADHEINLDNEFAVVSYRELLEKYARLDDPFSKSRDELAAHAEQLGVRVEEADDEAKILDNMYKKMARPNLVQPTFVVDYPKAYLPLAKSKPGDENLVDAFQLVIGGIEMVKAFSELNDPTEQASRFSREDEQSEKGDEEAQTSDDAFLEAMEYGMPPAGGVGIGIDRLVMLLTNVQNIREAIIFPTLKPKE